MSLLKVILAEDDPDDRFLIEEALFALKSVVTSTTFFTNGKDFWNFLQQIDAADLLPDLVVLDLNLPFMDGLSILKNIRSSANLADLPVFILTTSNKSRDKEACLAAGCTGYFVKPNSMRELEVIISRILFAVCKD